MQPQEIKSHLIRNGIKQSDIAKDLGVSGVMVHSVIHGKTKSKRVRGAISRILKTPVEIIWPE